MINRRKFLEAGAAVGVGAMLPLKVAKAAEVASRKATNAAAPGGAGVSPPLKKFVDELPNPIGPGFTYVPNGRIANMPYYEIPMTAFPHKMHQNLPDTPVWCYGGTFPSRTIETVVGQPIRVRWRNDLIIPDPARGIQGNPHPLAAAIDRVNVDGVDGYPDQRIATHLHGGHVPWTSDGGPKAWYTTGKKPMIADPAFFNGDTYDYPNNQPGTTLWFHDHAMGITRYNVMAGTAGFWILRDPKESTLNLPSGPYEMALAIQDRTFNADGTLFYPGPPLVPEFFGDTMLVNGKVWPFCNVEPRKYRIRFLDGCNARFLRMQLVVSDVNGVLPSSTRFWQNVPFVQIGAEGGFLPTPTAEFNQLLLAPAERADCIIDFSKFAGKHVLLFNDAATPFGNTADTRGSIPEVMLFHVAQTTNGTDTSTIPTDFTSQGLFSVADPVVIDSTRRRVTTLDEITDAKGFLRQFINQYGYEKDTFIGLPGVAVKPDTATLHDTEVWQIINTTVDVHPIHTHQTMFKILSRQTFDVKNYQRNRVHGTPLNPGPYLTGAATGPSPNETGFKDTVKANPGEVTQIALRWDDYTGHYVYHCHILEHEEHDMMRALDIFPAV